MTLEITACPKPAVALQRMEKVDMAPLEHVLIATAPSPPWGRVTLWCRHCCTELAHDLVSSHTIELVMLVRAADAHMEFDCPSAHLGPRWDWHPDFELESARLQADLERQEEIEATVREQVAQIERRKGFWLR